MNTAVASPTVADATEHALCLYAPAQAIPQYRGTAYAFEEIPVFSALHYTLLGEAVRGWVFVQPLLVTLVRDPDGYYLASDDVFSVYGDGNTIYAALQDYVISLIDYYQLLSARVENDPPTKALFDHLASYFRSSLQ